MTASPAPPPPVIEIHDDALLLPTTRFEPLRSHPRRKRYDGGACTAAGAPIPLARHRGDEHVNDLPLAPPDTPAAMLPGTWLFGGQLRDHFGHFLNESLGRLWAWAQLDKRPDGIVFLPHGAGVTEDQAEARRAMPLLQDTLRLLGIEAPVAVPAQPLRVTRLVVPEQLMLRHPWQRDLMRRLSEGPPRAEAPPVERAYVSRSLLGPLRSRLLLEELVEANFARAGYAIIHPERLSLEAQVAAYRGLRQVVFAEGSAIHLAAPLLPAGAKAGVIWRSAGAFPPMRQLFADCGVGPVFEFAGLLGFVATMPRGFQPRDGAPPLQLARQASCLLDLPRLGDALAAAGFLPREAWHDPTPAWIEAAVEATMAARRKVFRATRLAWFDLRPGAAAAVEQA